jgi:phosphatidylethanolamine-binding protein
MIDLDIPTDAPPATSTLLHWMQTGLTFANQASTLNLGTASQSVFLLQNSSNTAPLAPYFGPNPPARIPLSHRYTFVLVDHTNITPAGLTALTTAAATRRGFNAQQVLTSAGLASNVVAGNFFNVTNAGPATSATNGTGSGSAAPTGTSGTTRPTTSSFPGAAMSLNPHMGAVALCLGVVGAVFVGL